MVRKLALALLLIVVLTIGITLLKGLLTSEKARIRQRCQHLAALLTMPPGEKLPSAALRAERLRGLIGERCRFEIKTYNLTENYTRDEIVSRYLAVRRGFSSVEVLFRNIRVLSLDNDTATAAFTVKAVASSQSWGKESRTAPVSCRLNKIDGKWRFIEFREENALEK